MDNGPTEQQSKGMPGWVMALIVVGAFMFCMLPVLGGALAVLVPKIQGQQTKAVCAAQMRSFGAMYQNDKLTRGGQPDEGGMRYLLRLAKRAGVDGKTLVCPNDPHATPGKIVAVGDGEQDPATAPIFRAMCSYMVRDFARFPLDPDATTPQMIAADANDHGPHHRSGINVLYDDGSVRFKDRDSLDVAPGAPIAVGPESSHPELATLCIVPAR